MSTETLTDWLLRQVADDQAEAEAAYGDVWWSDDAFVYTDDEGADAEPTVHMYVNGGIYANQRRTAAYIARHDPARVLAACDAKRRIIIRCSETQLSRSEVAVHLANETMRDLAREYADRPGYEEWR